MWRVEGRAGVGARAGASLKPGAEGGAKPRALAQEQEQRQLTLGIRGKETKQCRFNQNGFTQLDSSSAQKKHKLEKSFCLFVGQIC